MDAWQPWAASAGVAGVVALRYWARDAWRRRRWARRRARGAAGEREAESLLQKRGYQIEARQPESTLTYRLDGRPVEVRVRADLIVTRRGRRYVGEVKTGAVAPRLETPATRRQLLEYAFAFEADGLLLIDADRSVVQRVGLPRPAAPLRPLVLAALLGLALGVTWMSWPPF